MGRARGPPERVGIDMVPVSQPPEGNIL